MEQDDDIELIGSGQIASMAIALFLVVVMLVTVLAYGTYKLIQLLY